MRTAKKYTRIYNARAQPFSCSLNLFGDKLVAVVDVVLFSSLFLIREGAFIMNGVLISFFDINVNVVQHLNEQQEIPWVKNC